MNTVAWLFTIDIGIQIIMLAGLAWSTAVPSRRIWPPPHRGAWQGRLTWALFYLVFGLNAALLVLDWNQWRFSSPLRYVPGIALTVIGLLLLSWGFRNLGARNTSGLRDGFVAAGPYRFSRNPQYLGDMLLFVGLSLIANSMHLWIAHTLLILVFAFTPWAEETWLEEQYGQAYRDYKLEVPRFL